MMPIHKRIDDKTVLIKTPPLHTRFWGDPEFNHPDGSGHVFPDAYAFPKPYGRADPHEKHEMRTGGESEKRYSYGGSGQFTQEHYPQDPWQNPGSGEMHRSSA